MDLSIYVVTDAAMCSRRGLSNTVAAAVEGGATTIQYRDKTADSRSQLRELEQVAQAIAGRALLLVNDHVDLAIMARARGIPVHGVHVGQRDGSALRARNLLGPEAIVGLTANTPRHLAEAEQLETGTVDYLGVGVIRATASKPDHPPALGVRGFSTLAASTPFPCVAIGGIGRGDVAAIRRAGGAGVAVISAVCAAADPERATRSLRQEWEGARL